MNLPNADQLGRLGGHDSSYTRVSLCRTKTHDWEGPMVVLAGLASRSMSSLGCHCNSANEINNARYPSDGHYWEPHADLRSGCDAQGRSSPSHMSHDFTLANDVTAIWGQTSPGLHRWKLLVTSVFSSMAEPMSRRLCLSTEAYRLCSDKSAACSLTMCENRADNLVSLPVSRPASRSDENLSKGRCRIHRGTRFKMSV